MKNELSRVVQPPEDADKIDEILEAIKRDMPSFGPPPWGVVVRFWTRKRLHFLGLHYWIGWRVYDDGSKRIVDTGHQVCAFCPRAR